MIAASGTVGSVWEWAEVADVGSFGGAVAKSVAPEPWPGRPEPRLAPTSTGMLNGIGIQNPGIGQWKDSMADRIRRLRVPIWGSAVAADPDGFLLVASGLAEAGVSAVEINLSCPNLDDGHLFSFDGEASASVIGAVSEVLSIPIGAKLSPDTPDIVGVASACLEAGADFLILTNSALGFGVDTTSRRPMLSGGIGGYSGPGLKPISLRCVYEVSTHIPEAFIVGCGGVSTGADVVEYIMAGSSAVELGTVLLAEPNAGRRILDELESELVRLGVSSVTELIGTVNEW